MARQAGEEGALGGPGEDSKGFGHTGAAVFGKKKKTNNLLGGSGQESTHQLGAELLFEPLLVAGQDGGIFQTSDGLRDQHVEAVLHGEHQQRPEDRRRRQTAE